MKSLHRMLMGALAGCALLAAGCDDDTTTSPTTTASQGGSGGSAGQGQGAGGTTAQGGQGGGSSGTGGSGGTGGGTGGQGGYSVELAQGQLGLNCMPTVPPDPLNGSFAATYSNNTDHDITFTITDARAVLTDGTDTLTWSFTVTPAEITTPPSWFSAFHEKDAGSGQGTGPGAPCGYCGGTLTLEVDWLVEGQPLSDSLEPITGFCAF